MAPEADIIICSLGKNLSSTNIIESITKIFDYATSVGKPAVVSISLGDPFEEFDREFGNGAFELRARAAVADLFALKSL